MQLPRPISLLTTALAGVFAITACTTWTTELAVVPGTPPPVKTASPRAATPAPAPEVAPDPAVDTGGTSGDGEETVKTVVKLKPRPAPGPFKMNLYRKGEFVHQTHKDWCVAGSALTMMNIIGDREPRSSPKLLKKLYDRGRELSPYKGRLGAIGVDLFGWRDLLNNRGYGPYEVTGSWTLEKAIQRAAKAIRRTGRPVGLVTWRGAHSWVMSGFTSTADPAYDKGFKVKAVNIQDTWYPFVSTIWGASRPPNALVPVDQLHEDYLPYRRPNGKWPSRDGKYMLILPVLPENTVVR